MSSSGRRSSLTLVHYSGDPGVTVENWETKQVVSMSWPAIFLYRAIGDRIRTSVIQHPVINYELVGSILRCLTS